LSPDCIGGNVPSVEPSLVERRDVEFDLDGVSKDLVMKAVAPWHGGTSPNEWSSIL